MFRVLVFLLAAALPVIASRPTLSELNAPSCGNVLTSIRPCLSYIKGTSDPSPGCCGGVKGLSKFAKTKPDKVAICGCIKNILGKVGPYNAGLIPALPKKCNVPINLPAIAQNYDCNKVTMFHISKKIGNTNGEPMPEGAIHAGIKANYIVDEPMHDKQDDIIQKGTVSENYKHILDVPMTEEQDNMASKGAVSENYKHVLDVPMADEPDLPDNIAPTGAVNEEFNYMLDALSKIYIYMLDVPMDDEPDPDHAAFEVAVSENYKYILDAVTELYTSILEVLEDDKPQPNNTAPKGAVSENYKHTLDVPMASEPQPEDDPPKGVISENYKYILDVPMASEPQPEDDPPKGVISENYKHTLEVPMAEEQDNMAAKGEVSENYNEDDGAILDVPAGL